LLRGWSTATTAPPRLSRKKREVSVRAAEIEYPFSPNGREQVEAAVSKQFGQVDRVPEAVVRVPREMFRADGGPRRIQNNTKLLCGIDQR